MSEHELPRWSGEIESLLEGERRAPVASAASTAARARVLQHLEGILGPALDGPRGTGAHGGASTGAGAALKTAAVKTSSVKVIALAFTAGALAGAGTLAGAQRLLRKVEAPVLAQAASATIPSAPVVSAPAPLPPPRASDVTSTKSHASKAPPAISSNSSAPAPHSAPADAEERALVETARTALQRGDAAGALATLDRLQTEHAHSSFDEEARALRVMSLCALGRAREARQEAAAFHREHPDSLLGQAVDQSVAALPPE